MKKPILFFVDISDTDDSGIKAKILKALPEEGLSVTDDHQSANFVVQTLQQSVKKPILPKQIQVLIGDFSRPQTVPAQAICVDQNTGLVPLANGPVPWREYVRGKI